MLQGTLSLNTILGAELERSKLEVRIHQTSQGPISPVRRWMLVGPDNLRAHFQRHGLTYRTLRLKLQKQWSVSTLHQVLNEYREPSDDQLWALAHLAAELEAKKGRS